MSKLALSWPISAAHVKPTAKTTNTQLMAAAEASFNVTLQSLCKMLEVAWN